MKIALEEARDAALREEVPIGAVLVHRNSGDVVARAGNRTIELHDPTAHAEIQVIRDVCGVVGAQRIPEYDLYVTLEPCPMCAAAISFARIGTVYFGAHDPKSGGITSDVDLYSRSQIHHKPQIFGGILEEECGSILKAFFQAKRLSL
ncbi:MAG TPA: nucleoside deaminase [Alphaproteobacteria bacterium]|nr:nucleoside deaminase [Alphaproteobacteria bacterium]HOO50456.1 nucleoside deaminase [Alphaproteobacteria bacterium]